MHATASPKIQARISREEFERFFEFSLDVLLIADLDGYLKHLNSTCEEVFGFSAREFLQRPFLDFVHPDDVDETRRILARLERGHDIVQFENRCLCKDGSYRWMLWNCPSPAPGTTRLYISGRDLTEKKKADSEIQRLNRELDQLLRAQTGELDYAQQEMESFAHTVAHDLRAPLRSMNGFSEALLEDYGETLDATATDYLKRIHQASSRMGELIDELLALSRVGRSRMRMTRVNLSSTAEEVLASLSSQFPDRNIETVIAPDVTGWGDPVLLRIVLRNLLENSWKFTTRNPAPRIEFGAGPRKGDKPVFFVRDNGIGMDGRFATQLFTPFQRLHSEDGFDGNGIGLAAVKRAIERHQGSVWIDSTLGQGTTVYFSLAHPQPDQKEHTND